MPIESATYISQLDPANPTGTDAKSTADDHMRLIKSVLKTQFPNFGSVAINATALALNHLTSAITADAAGNVDISRVSLGGNASATVRAGSAANASLHIAGNNNAAGSASLSLTQDTDNVARIQNHHPTGRLVLGANSLSSLIFDAAGNAIHTAPASPPTLSSGQVAMNLVSNTSLRISACGSDGVTRVANLALA